MTPEPTGAVSTFLGLSETHTTIQAQDRGATVFAWLEAEAWQR